MNPFLAAQCGACMVLVLLVLWFCRPLGRARQGHIYFASAGVMILCCCALEGIQVGRIANANSWLGWVCGGAYLLINFAMISMLFDKRISER